MTWLAGIVLAISPIAACSSSDTARGDRGEAVFACAAEAIEAQVVGSVPGDGRPKIDGTELPAGRAVAPGPGSDEEVGSDPVLWISDERVDAALRNKLVESFPNTGLWPVWLEGLEGQPERPWDVGEFDGGDITLIDTIDPEKWLGDTAEAARFDELAKPPPAPALSQECEADTIEVSGVPVNGRLGLIPAMRSADAITAIGWNGPINVTDDVAPYSAVLRSWEDRFGAQVVSIGFDTLTVVLTRPPSERTQLEELANEVWLLCGDAIDQGTGTSKALAQQLVSNPVIECWWD